MKKITVLIAICLTGIFTLSSCGTKYNAGDVMPSSSAARIDTVSYALGMYFGKTILASNFGELDLSEIRKGMMDVLNEKETRFAEDVFSSYLQSYVMDRQTYVAEKRTEENTAFFTENKTKEGVVETESGLQYKIITEGDGISPEPTDTVEVHYKGTLLDGTQFDSSYERGETTKFPLNQVIKGWSEGLTYAKEGGKIEIYVPSNLGYGQRNSGPIPGNSALIFEVELIKVFKATPKEEEPATPTKK